MDEESNVQILHIAVCDKPLSFCSELAQAPTTEEFSVVQTEGGHMLQNLQQLRPPA